MIRFHAPVRSTTLSVYTVVVIIVTLEIQERIQHDDDDDPTTRNSSYHSLFLPLSLFFHPPFLRWSVLRHTIRTMGHLGFQNLMDLIVPDAGHPRTSHMDRCLEKYTLSVDMIKKRWNWNLRYWSNLFFEDYGYLRTIWAKRKEYWKLNFSINPYRFFIFILRF